MNVEIMEFYPLHRENEDSFKGTIRVRLPDIGIQVLGIIVHKNGKRWYFELPYRRDHKDGEEVRYPLFCFEDKEKKYAFTNKLQEIGPSFIEKRLQDTVNPIVFKEKPKKPLHKKEKVEHKGHYEQKHKQPETKILKWTRADGFKKK